VEAVGSEVRTVKPGDHVITCLSAFCGHCEHCVTGHLSLCVSPETKRGPDDEPRLSSAQGPMMQYLNLSSFAEQMLIHEHACVAIRKDMPLDRACLIGCAVLTGYGAVRSSAGVEPGATVAVFGCGGVGLSAVQGARIAGAETIVAVDVHPGKLKLARAVGATETVDARRTDPAVAVREATDGGADYAFEAAGRPETIEQAWASLAVGGLLTVIGTLPSGTKLTLDADPLLGEKRIAGCYLGSASPERDVPALVELYLSGELRLDELVSRRIAVADLTDGFARMREGSEARQVVAFDHVPELSVVTQREELHVS
jgi:S-(hydroxymethyl)glutathione dehydrogenase/alcohol dehydrogenase